MMILPGCKPPFRLGQEVSGSVEQPSWHRPPIWLLLFDVHSWFTRSFPLTYSTTLTPTLRLLSTCGGKVIHTLPQSILLHVHKEIGMLPGLKQLSTLFWSRQISCPKHVSWQFPAQSLGLGSTPFHFHPWG